MIVVPQSEKARNEEMVGVGDPLSGIVLLVIVIIVRQADQSIEVEVVAGIVVVVIVEEVEIMIEDVINNMK